MTKYRFYYWGPMLFKIKLKPQDLKKCAKLCRKESSFVNDNLAGVIEHQHYVSTREYSQIINSYYVPFRQSYKQWYGHPLTATIKVVMAWANFMIAGEFNPPHVHENCDFSSVLFIKVPEKLKEEHKNFVGTAGGPGSLSFMYAAGQPYTISDKSFFPEEGDLFIFPAALTHFVSPFVSKGERISMSANFRLD